MTIKTLSTIAGATFASFAPAVVLAHHHTEDAAASSSSSALVLFVALAVVASCVVAWKAWPTLAKQQGSRR
ncbi:MAG: hypothetical protein AAGA33_06520 [Pseudomonadota bacterium]